MTDPSQKYLANNKIGTDAIFKSHEIFHIISCTVQPWFESLSPSYLTVAGLGMPLSRLFEGALYKFSE